MDMLKKFGGDALSGGIEKMKEYYLMKRVFVKDIQKNHSTEVIFSDIKVDTGIDSKFTMEKLEIHRSIPISTPDDHRNREGKYSSQSCPSKCEQHRLNGKDMLSSLVQGYTYDIQSDHDIFIPRYWNGSREDNRDARIP